MIKTQKDYILSIKINQFIDIHKSVLEEKMVRAYYHVEKAV